MAPGIEIVCSACGEETLLRREPVYEGFRKTGETLQCSTCGHVFASEDEVPYKEARTPAIFTDDDRPARVAVFGEDERRRVCRYCVHYVVNPFTQRCGRHDRFVEATDTCDDFTRRAPEE